MGTTTKTEQYHENGATYYYWATEVQKEKLFLYKKLNDILVTEGKELLKLLIARLKKAPVESIF